MCASCDIIDAFVIHCNVTLTYICNEGPLYNGEKHRRRRC